MPKIVIEEVDNTRPGVIAESTDVVFIPGFVDAGQEVAEGCTFLKANKPHLFTSVYEFESLCGAKPATFSSNQTYSSQFDSKAYSTSNNVMFNTGDPDPGYVMAKELLAAGLPVLYQRVNIEDSDTSSTNYNPIANIGALGAVNENSIYFYKDVNDAYHPYATKINYTEFKSLDDGSGAPQVFSINDLDKSTAEIAAWYDGGYYLTEDESGNFVPTDPATVTDTSNPTVKSSLLRKSVGEDGKPVYTLMSGIVEETYKMGEDEDASSHTYAFRTMITEEPEDWKDTYTTYFTKVVTPKTRSVSASTQFVLIPAVEAPYFKPYESGNVYEEVESTTSVFTVDNMYAALKGSAEVPGVYDKDNLEGLNDKGNFSIKYLTSGGYPVFEYDNNSIVNAMLSLAEARGDCVAIIDHTDFVDRPLNPNSSSSIYSAVNSASISYGEFGTMFTPWATYSRVTSDIEDSSFRAPASFAYLTSLADSIKTNANWLAIAGSARGGVKNLAVMDTIIPNGIADLMQPRDPEKTAINAITNIKPYGHTIWGNRTLKQNGENLIAGNFLNIRNLVSDVKKTCYRAARKYTFEQDTDILWINFKSEISKLLDKMQAGYGISGYKILRDVNHQFANAKATLCAKIILYPTYAVEDFYITVILEDNEVSVN